MIEHKKFDLDHEPTGNIPVKRQKPVEIGRHNSKAYAFYEGLNPKTKLHRYKLLTNPLDQEFKRIGIEFADEERGEIFFGADPDWINDPNLRALEYFDTLVDYHESGKFKIVRWDVDKYSLWKARMLKSGELERRVIKK